MDWPGARVVRAAACVYAGGMRSALVLSFVALVAAAPAHAQYGDDRHPDRPHPPTHSDSLRTLSGDWQVWTHAGVGWLGAPRDVRSRYNAGIDVGVSGDRRFENRLALRSRLDYHDLPSQRTRFIYLNGTGYPSNSNYGHGWLGSAFAGVAIRPWKHLWLEGGAGVGLFRSGFPSGQSYVDPVTGQTLKLTANSGWGGLWSSGASYEFKPTVRDRLLAECQFVAMDRGGARIQLWLVRIGYRAL